MMSARNSLADRRICSAPRSRPVVHTLVARKARGRAASQQVAGHHLGPAIHRRAVDNPSTGIDKQAQDLAQRPPRRLVRPYIKSSPRAEADDRHVLTGRRDRPRQHQRGVDLINVSMPPPPVHHRRRIPE